MSDSGSLIDGPQTEFSMGSNDSARTDPVEQEAVYDIMRATGNDWATDIPDVCRGRWHGIECMPDKDNVYHVVSLSFGALSDDTAFPICHPLRSYLSQSITKLPHIKTLFFYRCFSYNPQPIPKFLGGLGSSLQTLVLRENGHVGSIPTEVGNLTHLKVLDLHKNNLIDSIPYSLGRITGLKSLDLSGNKLSGSVPGLILPNLNVVDLSGNWLMGSIPSTLGRCSSLMKIDFSRNRLSGVMPDSIEGLKNLILMDLSYNRLTALPLASSMRNMNSLQVLILRGNPLNTVIPSDYFEGMKSLTTLVLSNMKLQGEIPESLGELPNVRVIYLDGNQLQGTIPTKLKELKHLTELRLNDNQLTGAIPFGRETIWRMRRKLRLENNKGLCYIDGLEDDSSISLCHRTNASVNISTSPTKTQLQHLSNAPTYISTTAALDTSHASHFQLRLIFVFLSSIINFL